MALLLPAACSRGPAAQPGSRVRLHYTLSAEGKAVQATEPGPPAEAVLGQRHLPPGLEKALLGLRAGDKKTAVLTSAEGFGAWRPELVKAMSAKLMPAPVAAGDTVHGMLAGKPAEARVLSADAEHVQLDFNHPLAGKTLRVELRVVSVEP